MSTPLNDFHSAVLSDRRASRRSAVVLALLSLAAFGLSTYIAIYSFRRAGEMRMDEVVPGVGAAVVGLLLAAFAVRGFIRRGPWTDSRVQAVTGGEASVVWIYKLIQDGYPSLTFGFDDGRLLSLSCASRDAMDAMFVALRERHPAPEFGLGWEPGKASQFHARYPR